MRRGCERGEDAEGVGWVATNWRRLAKIDGGIDRTMSGADDNPGRLAALAANHVARRDEQRQAKRQQGERKSQPPQPAAACQTYPHRLSFRTASATVLDDIDARSRRNIPTVSEPPVRVGPDGPDAHPRKTGGSRLDLALALAAIFISGVSLYVAIEHGKTERDLVAANSWPFLQANLSNLYGPTHDLAFGLTNAGVGPAKVESYEVAYQDAPVRSPVDLLRRCCGLSPDRATTIAQVNNGVEASLVDDTVLRAGEDNEVVIVRRAKVNPEVVSRFQDALLKLSFRACYCSVFDECWTTNLRSTHVTRVKTCPAPRVRFDPNGGR